MTTAVAPLAAALAALTLQAAPAPGDGASPQAGPLRLRARGADAALLLMFVFGDSPRLLVTTPGVGAPVTLDVARPTPEALEEAALRAAGAPSLALGQVVLVGDLDRLEAARTNSLRTLLQKSGYTGRKVKLQFRGITLQSLLGLLSDVGKRRFAVAEGVEGKVVVATGSRAWNEALDALLVAADLARDLEGEVVRIRRRDDPAPRFTPLEARLKEAQANIKPPAPVKTRCGAPQGFHDLAVIRLVATLTGAKGQALLALPEDRSAVIEVGSCIGKDGGKVTRIEPGRLVIEQRDPDGALGGEPVILELPDR